MAVDSSSLITSRLINVNCLFDSGTTSCEWYTCAWYETRNMSSFCGWVRVKQQILLESIRGFLFKSETSHLRDLNTVWKPHTARWNKTTVTALYTTCSKWLSPCTHLPITSCSLGMFYHVPISHTLSRRSLIYTTLLYTQLALPYMEIRCHLTILHC